jgi:hypothetical protein
MSDELEHSGKKGMRWGERNYQRKDGTWTPLGLRLRRAREGTSASKRKPSGDAQKRADRKNEIKNLQSRAELDNAKAAYKINKAQNKSAVKAAKAGAASIGNKIKDAAKKASEARKEKKREESVEEIVRSGDMKKILQNKTKLTDDELRAASQRLQLEQQLSSISDKKKQSALDAYKRFADVVGTTANLTKNGISIYNNIASVLNTFTDSDLMIVKVGKEGGGEAGRMFGEAGRMFGDAAARRRQSSNSSTSSDDTNRNTPGSNDTQSSNSSQSSGSPVRPNDAVNQRARERAAEANARRNTSNQSTTPNNAAQSANNNQSSNQSQRANTESFRRAQEAAENFRDRYSSNRSGTATVSGNGTSRRQAETVTERHARERASAVDVDARDVVENEIIPLVRDERIRH